jgi:DNA-binding NtrC family response regulator
MNQAGPDAPRTKYSVLVVDDDAALLETLAASLEDRYEVATTTFPTRALKWVETRDFHVVVTDWHMPVMDGMTLVREVRRRAQAVACLLMTADMALFATDIARTDRGLLGLIAKPFPPEKLIERVDQLAGLAEMKRTVRRLPR